MGYDVVRSAVAAKVKWEDRVYVTVALLIADSNLIGDNGMAESWNMLVPGLEWEVMQDAVKLSSDCESGCLKWGSGKGRNILPETFIRRIRDTVRNAPFVTELHTCIPGSSSFEVQWPLPDAKWKRKDLEEAWKRGIVSEVSEIEDWRNRPTLAARFNGLPASVAFAAEARGSSHLWCH